MPRGVDRRRLVVLAAVVALTVVAGVLRYTDVAQVALFFVSLAVTGPREPIRVV